MTGRHGAASLFVVLRGDHEVAQLGSTRKNQKLPLHTLVYPKIFM
jgi:hypothetical protein